LSLESGYVRDIDNVKKTLFSQGYYISGSSRYDKWFKSKEL